MKLLKYFVAICCCMALLSCEDEISTLGSSLETSEIKVVVDSTFVNLTGQSAFTDSIIGRTTDPLLGNLTVSNYGTLRTGYLTQFMPSINIDTLNVTPQTIDSINLYLSYYNSDLTGDSLAPMILDVYRLNKTIKAPLYTNINPDDYYSPDDWLARCTFGSSTEGFVDSNSSSSSSTSKEEAKTYKRISVKLPKAFGEELFNQYKKDPNTFAMPSEFAKFFPGMYVDISYGNGRVINIKSIFMTMYYRAIDSKGKIDTLAYTYMGVTPEVYSINHFTLTPDELLLQNIEESNANGKAVYVQAPIGYMPVINFPTQNIIDRYEQEMIGNEKIQNILNALSFTIPAVVDEDAALSPPKYLLFIRKSQVKEFFEEKKLPDQIGTVYATYNKSKKVYDFGNIGSYIRQIMDSGKPVTKDDEEIALIPIDVTSETNSGYYETTTTITNVTPYCASPAMVKLDLSGAQIKITYTTQQPIE